MSQDSVPIGELKSFLSSVFSVPIDHGLVEELATSITPFYLQAGETLMQEGDPGDAMYAVIGGRLLTYVTQADGSEIAIGEIGAGATVGEMAMITDEPRSATVRAIRDTQLVRITRQAFEQLIGKQPEAMLDLVRVIVHRTVRLMHHGREEPPIKTIALVAMDAHVPLGDVAARLSSALERFGRVLRFDRLAFDAQFGAGAGDLPPDAGARNQEIAARLSSHEADHQFVIYETDRTAPAWTVRCLRQADRIVLVTSASGPRAGEQAHEALREATAVSPLVAREVVVVHENGSARPVDTRRWLSGEEVMRHTHVALDRPADFHRLGRLLAGRGVGLVLGGGGARGFAHIGVLRALAEAQIPIDGIGGVSMGAIIAAQHAMRLSPDAIIEQNRAGIAEAKLTRDITLPLISLSSGHRFDRALQEFFGDIRIEDLWLGFLCVSTNLSTADTFVHRAGPLWQAVKASNSAPGILPPVVQGGHMLVDGGILNNEPGDIMKRYTGGPVIVVNVGATEELSFDPAYDVPSPWAVLGHRLSPLHRPLVHPDIGSMITRSMMVGSRHKSMEIESATKYYLRPPVDQYRADDYSKIDEIAEAGYVYARQQVASWRELQTDAT